MVWNYGNAQTSYTGSVKMDFSNYPSTNDILPQVSVPINVSVPANSTNSFWRFLKAGMTYQLQITVSGTVYASIYDSYGQDYPLNNQQINSSYSASFTATDDGVYWFYFQNQNILSSKSVTGTLLINRGTSSENFKNGQAKIIR